MLPTLVIGLREGLEAALIVGIIAAFLRKNGKSLTPMWIGVGIAVALSIAVGVVLRAIEQALPQAAQEGMESIIGAVAVVFVTGMIVWMNTHSRGLKHELEAEANEAINDGHAYALAGMAFLAVLKEGFETSVFLLATFTASSSMALAATGAVIGVAAAILIGTGIYAGSVKLNLSTFFRWTGGFLILVAAGLVLTALRTAHEAGWLNAGQQTVLDLSAVVRPGTVQSALLTGVLGIPADPRLIEVIGWFAYLIPVVLFVYWPRARRAHGMQIARLQFGVAGAIAIVALGLVAFFPRVGAPQLPAAAISGAVGASGGTAQLAGDSFYFTLDGNSTRVHLDPAKSATAEVNGIVARHWKLPVAPTQTTAPSSVTLAQLIELNGGRLPVGVNAQTDPGPFDAGWSTGGTLEVFSAEGALLDATQTARTVVTISGGGLSTPRTISVDDSRYAAPSWAVTSASSTKAQAAVNDALASQTERAFWAVQLPIALGLAALITAAFGLRSRRRALTDQKTPVGPTASPAIPATPQRSKSYAAQ
ncbi:iron uptake transporter permease EfeU [Gryllotalpicola protaetiae]|uniref:Iron permease n=1 Tax=Gryllotalpicola protaetiae TaxID=2419771 RepID=A0A387BJV7_9MICO|nr:iron uptake transporter permease EfeU [Gryllotalpicola protaetiae]AYG02552.1 iron permease [Gryllotalpicola protaetiae]